ncbi:WbqC family protein [Desulforudis sp. 1088]|uniref:WbqC family protein n=1 Tax=unclassified Candidatus Desulforudis TaxID=2635950 RepID=UPI003CE4A4A6
MRAAVMQPYFSPYIGYWQLIHAVDTFVLFDDVQYIRHGWINRNRILKPGGGWQYIIALKKHSKNDLIRNIQAHPTLEWKARILRQLEHYKNNGIQVNKDPSGEIPRKRGFWCVSIFYNW